MSRLRGGSLLQMKHRKVQEERAQENISHRQQFLAEMLATFTESLKKFAVEHKDEIVKHPEFRLKFHALCRSVGVDPLTSSKGMWASLLGVGAFYYELAVQIVDVCISTRPQNGGLIELSELKSRVEYLRKHTGTISNDDLIRAIGKLTVLRSGYSIQRIGKQIFIQSVPNELNQDHRSLIELAQKHGGHFTQQDITNELRWDADRITRTINTMTKDGTMMIDEQDPSGSVAYWVVGLLHIEQDGRLTVESDTTTETPDIPTSSS